MTRFPKFIKKAEEADKCLWTVHKQILKLERKTVFLKAICWNNFSRFLHAFCCHSLLISPFLMDHEVLDFPASAPPSMTLPLTHAECHVHSVWSKSRTRHSLRWVVQRGISSWPSSPWFLICYVLGRLWTFHNYSNIATVERMTVLIGTLSSTTAFVTLKAFLFT